MKKQVIIVFFILLTITIIQNANGQDLMGRLHGTWNITKYQSKIKTQSTTGKITFEPDGGFVSEGIYFGTKKGLFTTDETRSVVIVEIDQVKTEWMASIKNGVLKLRTPSGTRQPKVYMVFEKVKR